MILQVLHSLNVAFGTSARGSAISSFVILNTRMKLVILGLTVSSSWGNGHATLWRGLLNALARDSHRCIFFERNVPWYESTRDLCSPENFDLVLYPSWEEIRERAGPKSWTQMPRL